MLRSSIERAAEQAKEAVRAQLLRELDAEEEVRGRLKGCFHGSQIVSQFGRLTSQIVRPVVELRDIYRAPLEVHQYWNCVTFGGFKTQIECSWKHAL